MNDQEKITVGACWSGDYYPIEYVNILFRSVSRHTTIPFDSILYTGPRAEEPGRLSGLDLSIKVVPVNLPSWWSKLPFFKPNPPGVRTKTILYLDLDQVIVGSLDDLILFPSNLACMKDYPSRSCPKGKNLENDGCASTMLIRGDGGRRIWEEYQKEGAPVWDALRGGPFFQTDQGILNNKQFNIKKDLFPENWVCSYKLEVRKNGLPSDCRIVAFHGYPKPHECSEPWVKENWV